ncbi:MAG: response regulator transcription factor [Bacteroidia bacterium]|nr:response regulator transcription factor [Bacteroidia bacterium]
MAIRISIFEDNVRLLDSLVVLLEGSPGFQMVGAFPDCSDLERKIEKSQPDVILMDIELPGMTGIEAVKIVKQRFPNVNVMMQTAFENDENIFDAICAGASGYILKNTPPTKILESIVEVYQGGSPMSPSVARKVLGFMQKSVEGEKKSEPVENYNLSVREKDVLSCLVKGMSYKMIADHCSISYETVRSHMKNIYEKLHVASMTEAVAKAINQKLVK